MTQYLMPRTPLRTRLCILLVSLASSAVMGACSQSEISVQVRSPPAQVVSGAELQNMLEGLQTRNAEVPGFAVSVVYPDGAMVSASTGIASPDTRPMTTDTPVRWASTSKTLVAAVVLRLHEDNRIDLDDPIDTLLPADWTARLEADGYATSEITVRHLLMHSSGLPDRFNTESFQRLVLDDPAKVWTARSQIEAFLMDTAPLGEPGEAFAYSDPGYILLGKIIETRASQPLGDAVRSLLDLEAHGMRDAYWEGGTPPEATPDRAHQWLGDFDTYDIHGSVDAFGGGGLISSVGEVAALYWALFNGRVYRNEDTLHLMVNAPGRPADSPYRIGLFVIDLGGYRAYEHSGFWGSYAVFVPELNISIAAVSLKQSGFGAIRSFSESLIELAGDRGDASGSEE